MAKKQFLLYIEEELLARIQNAATSTGRRTHNEVAVEILETYLPLWERAEGAKAAVIAEQMSLLDDTGAYARGKSKPGEIEKVKKDAISRKPKSKK